MQVENRSVVPPQVPRQQELDARSVAGITRATRTVPQTAAALPRLAQVARPPRIQSPAPPGAAPTVALRAAVPRPLAVAAPVRPAVPVGEGSPRPLVSAPVVAVDRDAALSTSPPSPVPTAGATPPEPSATAFAEPPATRPPAAPPAAAPVVAQRSAVEAVLGQYARAFSALDARQAKAVWPTVNQKNLQRAFDSLEQQEFDLGACDITVLPPRALALCEGTARYTPRVGNKKARTESGRWSFALRQTGQEWAIESVDLR